MFCFPEHVNCNSCLIFPVTEGSVGPFLFLFLVLFVLFSFSQMQTLKNSRGLGWCCSPPGGAVTPWPSAEPGLGLAFLLCLSLHGAPSSAQSTRPCSALRRLCQPLTSALLSLRPDLRLVPTHPCVWTAALRLVCLSSPDSSCLLSP